MPGIIHKVPDPNDAVVKAVALQIHRKRKLIEKAKNEEEAREMEKKRKDDEKRKKLEQQTKSLAAVKEELDQLHKKLNSLKEDKHRLFNELKKVCHKEKEEKEKAEQMNSYLPCLTQVYHTHGQYDAQGKLSIMGSRRSDKPGYAHLQHPNHQRNPPLRILTPTSPHSNPYLRPNAQQSRYLKVPSSPAPSLNNP